MVKNKLKKIKTKKNFHFTKNSQAHKKCAILMMLLGEDEASENPEKPWSKRSSTTR